MQKNLNFKTQFTHVFRRPGAQSQKLNFILDKTYSIIWSKILKKVAVNVALKTLKKIYI